MQNLCGTHCTIPSRITSVVISLSGAYLLKNSMSLSLFHASFYFSCGGYKTRKKACYQNMEAKFYLQERCLELVMIHTDCQRPDSPGI